MYISSQNVDDGYTPNNGTIYPWIDSEAQVKLKLLSSVSLNILSININHIYLNIECLICAIN